MRRPNPGWLPALALLLCSGCIERWVHVRFVSAPPGATVASKGLPKPHRVRKGRAPGGHFLPCSIDAIDPKVTVEPAHWSYTFTKADHSDEQVFVDRAKVARFCADSKAEARKKPYVVRAALLATTTEKGLHNTVKITTLPPGARVFDDRTGKVLGDTPLQHKFVFYAPYTMIYTIRIERPGYATVKRKVHAKTFTVHATLEVR